MDEDMIYHQICEERNCEFSEHNLPSKFFISIYNDSEKLKSLYPDFSFTVAQRYLQDRMDRCLVASLVTTLKDNDNLLETVQEWVRQVILH